MFKKYMKWAIFMFVPVLLSSLYVLSGSVRTIGMSSSSMYGNIPHRYIPGFGDALGTTILLTFCMVIVFSLLVFSELRSRTVGYFIGALPLNSTSIFNAIFVSGGCFILLSFATMGAVYACRTNALIQSATMVFTEYGRPDYAVDMAANIWQAGRRDFANCLAVTFCAFAAFTFVQTLFQKPTAALIAFIGSIGGFMLTVMTLDKYNLVLTHRFDNQLAIVTGRLRRIISFSASDDITWLFTLLFVLAVLTVMFYVFGLLCFKKGIFRGDLIFTFPPVKTVMMTGITFCAGCLAVFILSVMVGLYQLQLGTMNIFFMLGAVFAFLITRRIFKIIG